MDFASLWRGNDSSSNKQQNQTSERQPANEGESVLMCCIHSQLLIRYWDFVFMETEGLILEQRLLCNVGRLIRAEKELVLPSLSAGRLAGCRELWCPWCWEQKVLVLPRQQPEQGCLLQQIPGIPFNLHAELITCPSTQMASE